MKKKPNNDAIKKAARQIGCSAYIAKKIIAAGGLNMDSKGNFLHEDLEFNRIVWEYVTAIKKAPID